MGGLLNTRKGLSTPNMKSVGAFLIRGMHAHTNQKPSVLHAYHSHSGSGIEAALAEEVGTRFAIEKPRAKDFWVGAIGAATRRQRKEIGRGISSLERILK